MKSQKLLIKKIKEIKALAEQYPNVLVCVIAKDDSYVVCLPSEVEFEDDKLKFSGCIDSSFGPYWVPLDGFYIKRELIDVVKTM